MQLTEINKSDFKISDSRNKTTVFQFNDSEYKLILGSVQEIRMSVYVYFDVKFFENNKLLLSGEMLDPEYYEPHSPNKKFVYVPLKGCSEIINLETKQKINTAVTWFKGNIFNQSSTKMIITGANEFKVIDLVKMKEIFHFEGEKQYISDAFFVDENLIWRFTISGEIAELNLETKTQKLVNIELPFVKFGIDLANYQTLIDTKKHCLALPKGGLAYAGILNHWNYVNTKEKLVFETLVPTSTIKYSKGYERDYCDVVFKYVELTKVGPMTYKKSDETPSKIKESNKNTIWSKIKKAWS